MADVARGGVGQNVQDEEGAAGAETGDIMSGPHLALRFNPTSEHRDHFLAFSGGLLVGWVEADAGKWQWSMFGVHITGDSGAKLQGICDTLEGAQRELSGSWLAWVEWAGLQPKR